MNRNTKNRFNIAKKNKNKGQKSTVFEIPVIGGNYKKTFSFEYMPRKSKYAKVARHGQKTKTEIEQEEIQAATQEEISKIESAKIEIV